MICGVKVRSVVPLSMMPESAVPLPFDSWVDPTFAVKSTPLHRQYGRNGQRTSSTWPATWSSAACR